MQVSEIIRKSDFDILLIHSYKYGDIEFMISKEDTEAVSKYKWSVAKRHHGIYAACNQRYDYPSERMLHRFIMQPEKGMCVDHINRNTLDNRRNNLRVCTYTQNNMNTSRQTSKLNIRHIHLIGDETRKRNQKYYLEIGKEYRKRFYTLIEAILARNEYLKVYKNEYWQIHKDEFIKDLKIFNQRPLAGVLGKLGIKPFGRYLTHLLGALSGLSVNNLRKLLDEILRNKLCSKKM